MYLRGVYICEGCVYVYVAVRCLCGVYVCVSVRCEVCKLFMCVRHVWL